ncbi:TfoX family protein [Jiella endophytica]|uniref:TfoX family protein n=1 Tax=Jiella endophytica TaxID=2558362 RepID=A0A4Y8RTI3_9HYPH|nr:TfoX/Sxy family protein [Jiella endophytica]TFF27605.1 TfoX family protein [Jiella endophytica]
MDEEFLRDLFRSLPAISIRRLFGGQGIYSDGRIVAIVIRGNLYLKSDPESEASYAGAGLERWTYARAGKAPVSMPYWRFPEDGYDDPDEAERWIAVADQAARRVDMAEAGKRVAASKRGRAGRKAT